MEKTCCVLGAYIRLKQSDALEAVLREQIQRLALQGVCTFQTAMERGAELLSAQTILKCKETDAQIRLECVIPYEEQAALWTEEERDTYFTIIAQCDREIRLQAGYTPDCMEKCCQYLLKNSEYVLAICDETIHNETEKMIRRAREMGRKVIVIHPDIFKIQD